MGSTRNSAALVAIRHTRLGVQWGWLREGRERLLRRLAWSGRGPRCFRYGVRLLRLRWESLGNRSRSSRRPRRWLLPRKTKPLRPRTEPLRSRTGPLRRVTGQPPLRNKPLPRANSATAAVGVNGTADYQATAATRMGVSEDFPGLSASAVRFQESARDLVLGFIEDPFRRPAFHDEAFR